MARTIRLAGSPTKQQNTLELGFELPEAGYLICEHVVHCSPHFLRLAFYCEVTLA